MQFRGGRINVLRVFVKAANVVFYVRAYADASDGVHRGVLVLSHLCEVVMLSLCVMLMIVYF